jgi:peptidyl-prolyl cis-trans isomerase D
MNSIRACIRNNTFTYTKLLFRRRNITNHLRFVALSVTLRAFILQFRESVNLLASEQRFNRTGNSGGKVMLEFIRNHVGGLVGLLIIGALSFVFAVSFGQQSQGWGRGAGDDTAITVDGVDLSMATLEYAINMNTNRDIAKDSPEYASLRQQAAKGLIERQLLLTMAEKAGISASTDEAQENIIKGEFFITRPISTIVTQLGFQRMYGELSPDRVVSILVKDGHRAMLGRFVDAKGKFDVKSFNNVVRYQLNYKEPAFVEEQRLEIIAQRMRTLLLSGIEVTEAAVKEAYQSENDTVSLSYIKFAPALYAGNLDSESDELTRWTQANADKIKQYYETNKFKYTNVEKSARARHILIKVDEDADEETQNAAKAKAEALLAQIKAGADFAKLAAENSEDPGSAKKGGDLGYNPRGVMVPEFDEAMFSMKPGDVSDLVRTQFGYHIIKLEGFREGTISLADATDEIARKLFQENRGKDVMSKLAEKMLAKMNSGADISELISESGNTGSTDLGDGTTDEGDTEREDKEVVAAKDGVNIPEGVHLTVQATSPFNRTEAFIPGIGKSEELVKAAFSMTRDAPTGGKVFAVNDNYYVVQLKERKEPSDKDYEEQKTEIENRLLAAKIITWMNDRVSSILTSAMEAGQIKSVIPLPSTLARNEVKTKKAVPAPKATRKATPNTEGAGNDESKEAEDNDE